MVYHDHDRIISVGVRQSGDEVHRYGGEWERVFNGQRRKSRDGGVCIYFGRLTVSTSRNELSEEGGHSWPPIVLLHAVESAEEPFMPSSRGGMEGLY